MGVDAPAPYLMRPCSRIQTKKLHGTARHGTVKKRDERERDEGRKDHHQRWDRELKS